MAVQLCEAAGVLPWVMEPTTPPVDARGRAGGFRRSRNREGWHLTKEGAAQAGVVQRMLLRYVLLGESREQIAERYGYASRHVQGILGGTTYPYLTHPVRHRLLWLGIGNLRMNRDSDRSEQIRRALERLSGKAAEMIRNPEWFSAQARETVARDLWLISGGWREEEQR
jgi:hypothetical protein